MERPSGGWALRACPKPSTTVRRNEARTKYFVAFIRWTKAQVLGISRHLWCHPPIDQSGPGGSGMRSKRLRFAGVPREFSPPDPAMNSLSPRPVVEILETRVAPATVYFMQGGSVGVLR